MRTVAFIGFGRFGQLLVELILKHTQWQVLVVSSRTHQVDNNRLSFGSFADLNAADYVIPTVPISEFESTLQKIVPHLKATATVIDVCSVKVLPVQLMLQYLPATVNIIATHPMFGPDSYRKNNGLRGLPLVIHSVRSIPQRYDKFKNFLTNLGLTVVEMTPEAHDRAAAYTQAYSFLIGKIGVEMPLQQTAIDTWSYRLLREQAEIIGHDSDQLFLDIQRYNPYATEMRERFKTVVENIFSKLELAT